MSPQQWMTYLWRRLHALSDCKFDENHSRDEWTVDVGYCLDRYSIEHVPGIFTRVIP